MIKDKHHTRPTGFESHVGQIKASLQRGSSHDQSWSRQYILYRLLVLPCVYTMGIVDRLSIYKVVGYLSTIWYTLLGFLSSMM